MKNDSTMGGVKISVPPTLLVSAIGQIDDVADARSRSTSSSTGDVVYLLGDDAATRPGERVLPASRRARRSARGARASPRPTSGTASRASTPRETLPLYRALEAAIRRRARSRSAATPAKGGLALALARCAMAGELGLELDLDRAPDLARSPPDVALFSESNGRFVVTVGGAGRRVRSKRSSRPACRRIGYGDRSRRRFA